MHVFCRRSAQKYNVFILMHSIFPHWIAKAIGTAHVKTWRTTPLVSALRWSCTILPHSNLDSEEGDN